jgi:adenosylhomocysteinase
LAREGASMDNAVYDITTEQDQDLATTKLETLGFSIDVLTDAQLAYLDDYTVGT